MLQLWTLKTALFKVNSAARQRASAPYPNQLHKPLKRHLQCLAICHGRIIIEAPPSRKLGSIKQGVSSNGGGQQVPSIGHPASPRQPAFSCGVKPKEPKTSKQKSRNRHTILSASIPCSRLLMDSKLLHNHRLSQNLKCSYKLYPTPMPVVGYHGKSRPPQLRMACKMQKSSHTIRVPSTLVHHRSAPNIHSLASARRRYALACTSGSCCRSRPS